MEQMLWVAAGAVGSFLIWNAERMEGRLPWCPTPRAILFGTIAAGIGGPILLIGGIVWAVIDLVSNSRLGDCWFTRPICQRRRD